MNHKIRSIAFRYRIIQISILILLANISFIFIESGSGRKTNDSIFYVDINGEGNFSSIQNAIDFAQSGDTIIVLNGIYYENIVIDKKLFLIGKDRNNTIIDGREAGNVVKINAENVTIQGFTIQHSGIYYPNSGINLSSDYNSITENIIKNNFYGITLFHSFNNSIQKNIIKENNHCGIYMTNSSYNLIYGNILKDHNYNGIGIYYNSDYNNVINNILFKNGYCGVNIRISSMNSIESNNISNNNIGIHIPSNKNEIDDNYFSNNRIDIEDEKATPGFQVFQILIIFMIMFFIFNKRKSRFY